MQRTAVWVVTSMIGLASAALASAQPATDPTMRVLDDASDVARVLDDLDGRRAEAEGDAREEPERESEGEAERGRRAAPPSADRAVERRPPKLDARDDERGESALDDDDVARAPPPAAGA